MYAVVKIGANQHIVRKDEILKVNKLADEAGQDITIDKVLAVGEDANLVFGTPFVDGAFVKLHILENKKDKKVLVFKKKRRKGYERKKGHRQHISVVKVTEISKG